MRAVVALLIVFAAAPASAEEVHITIDRMEVPPNQPGQAALQQAADDAQAHLQSEASSVLRENHRPLCSALPGGAVPCFLVDRWDFGLGVAAPEEVLPLLQGQAYHFAALVHGRTSRDEQGEVVQVRARVATFPDRVLPIDFDYRAEAWIEFRRLFRAALLYSVARAEVAEGSTPVADTAELLAKARGELNDFARFDADCAQGLFEGTVTASVAPDPAVVGGTEPTESGFGGVILRGPGVLCREIGAGLVEIDALLRAREAS